MKVESTTSAAEALGQATARQAEALDEVRRATTPSDLVTLSPDALDPARAAPVSPEEAVTDAVAAAAAVDAAAAVVKAEEERQRALIFVLAHHGGPLRG